MREVCDIFNCSYKSLYRWITIYKKNKNIKRKESSKKHHKVTKDIEKYVIELVKKYVNITLWEISKLVDKKYKVRLNDKTIFNILKNYKITRKRVRSKYYPEKKEGQDKLDLNIFYKNLKKYNYKKTISIDKNIYLFEYVINLCTI